MAHRRMKAARGFTLIELAVVTVILGVLLAVLRPSIGLTQSAAIADQMQRIADAGTENWLILAAAAQVNPAQPGALIASNYYMTDAIFQGLPAIAPAYQAIYKSTNIKPLDYLAVPMPGASGNGSYVLKATALKVIHRLIESRRTRQSKLPLMVSGGVRWSWMQWWNVVLSKAR